jgi:hypothetical protein
MPDLTPVATQIKPPDPMQGINTYSGILGLQQQQQNLQTGQYTQQSAQATAGVDQLKNKELQAVSGLMKNVHDGGYRKSDGTLDQQRFADDVQTVAPVNGQQIASSARTQANEIVQNQKAKQDLTDSARTSLGTGLTALAKDPNTKRGDVVDYYTNWLQDHKDDPAAFRVGVAQAAMLPQNDADPKYRETLGKYAATLTGQPTTAPTTVDTGGGIQPGQASNITGAITPAGPPIQKTMAPHQVKNEAGQIVNVSPAGSVQVAPGANPTTAQASTVNTAAAGVSNRVQQAQAAANNTTQAQDALTRTREILDKPDAIGTGAGFAWKKAVRNVLASAGIDTAGADDANTLVKNLARYEAARATQAGLGGTDAARELAHNGSPNASLSTEALKGVVTQSLATEKALAAYASVQGKTKDPDKLARNEADFRGIPNLVQGYEYGLARNPQEAEEFLKKHGLTRADMAKTRAAIKEFEGRQ